MAVQTPSIIIEGTVSCTFTSANWRKVHKMLGMEVVRERDYPTLRQGLRDRKIKTLRK